MNQYIDYDESMDEAQLCIYNSVWNNTDLGGNFKERYKEYIKRNFDSEAYEKSASEITVAVNKWVKDGTNGLIPKISDDLSNTAAVLVNTVYLKSAFLNQFEEHLTKKDEFTTIDGSKTTKEFMQQQKKFRYYEKDENNKVLIMDLEGGIDIAFILGDIDVNSIDENASYEEVIVKIPKFDINSSFENGELADFIKYKGADIAFSDEADFSVMCDFPWVIDDIIQKARIKTDEKGIEAAAATAIMMKDALCIIERVEPKEFIADRPFKFVVFTDNKVELFRGQCVK